MKKNIITLDKVDMKKGADYPSLGKKAAPFFIFMKLREWKNMKKTIRKLIVVFLSICMIINILTPYGILASDTTEQQAMELDDYIQTVTMEYQSGEDWIKITDETKEIPADARLKITVTYKDVKAKELLEHNKTLKYHLPELFQKGTVAYNSIKDANGNEIGKIQVEEETQDVLMNFDESFLEEEEEENKKVDGSFSVYVTADREQIKQNPTQTVKFGDVTIKLNFEENSNARLGTLKLTKTEPTFSEEDGKGYLTYRLVAESGEDPMPDVVVKDQFTNNQDYIDSYLGIDTTKKDTQHMENADNIPYEATGFQSKVYLQDDSKPGTMVWEIGDMSAHEVRTLTYKVRVKDSYIGNISKGTITNTAKAYSKSYEHQSASSDFTSKAGMQVQKTAGAYTKDPSGNGGTILYTVYVKANDDNTYTLNNVKLYDNFNSGTASNMLQYINYEADSVTIYDGNKADEDKKLDIPASPSQGKSNPNIVNDKNKTCKMDLYLGNLKPGAERTITYKVRVSGDIFAAGNNEIKLKNTAALFSDDTVSDGNKKFNSATQEKSLGKKVWDRKLQSEQTTTQEQITVPEQDKIYDSNMQISPVALKNFTVPKGSFKYQIVVNETGDFDVSSAVFGDALANDYLAYTGYVKVDYFDTGLEDDSENDQEAVTKLEGKTPKETVWIDVNGQKTFSFSPKDVEENSGKGAYLLTYYATPQNLENLTQVVSGNSFTLKGDVIGPGGTNIKLAGVKVSTTTVIEGGNNFSANKCGWYFDATKTSEGNYQWGSLYWVIEASGNKIPAGTVFRDQPQGAYGHKMQSDSLVGVYKGKISDGQKFQYYYGTEKELLEDHTLQKLTGNKTDTGEVPENADYQWSTAGNDTKKYADITLKKDVHLDEGEHLYIVIKTAINRKLNPPRDSYTYENALLVKDSSAKDFVSQGTASQIANGGGNNYKEARGIYERDDAGNWKYLNNAGNYNRLLQNLVTEAGTYIEWRLKINYVGNTEGKVLIEDQLPEGIDLVYVRYAMIASEIQNEKAPVMTEIPEYENNSQWKKMTLTAKLDGGTKSYTSIAYYNEKTRKLCMAVDNLKGGGDKDKQSLELQVLARVTDEEVLLDGKSKDFANTMIVKKENGQQLSTSTAVSNVSKKTLTKEKQAVKDGKLPFTLTVNESGEDLVKGEDKITLVDEMQSPLQFDTDSVQVKDKNGSLVTGITPKIENTSTGQKMSLVIPDNQKLTITYNAKLNAPPDTDITVNNKAYWFGHSTDVAVIENETVRYHVEATAGTTTTPTVKVKKVDKNDTSKALSGAAFMIHEVEYNDLTKTWEMPDNAKIYTKDTDETGIAAFGKNETLSYNKVYCLRETKAPDGYVLDATPKYFVIAKKTGTSGEETYPSELSKWQDLGVEVYYLGSTYQCNMYDSKGTLNVEKTFTDEQGKPLSGTKIPDGTYSFGLYEDKGDQADYSKENKLQKLTITSKDGNLTYKCNGESVSNPQFDKVSVGKTYRVFELDQNGDPITKSGTSYQPEKDFSFEVTYKQDTTSYEIKEDGTSNEAQITNRYYLNIQPSTGVFTDQMKLYILMAGIGIAAIVLAILKRPRYRRRTYKE